MINEIYSAVSHLLNLKPQHKTNLLERGFTLQEIDTLGYKTLPKTGIPANKIHSLSKTLEKKGFSLNDVAGFYIGKGDKNHSIVKPFYVLKKGDEKKHCDSILVPVRNKNGEIAAFKIRLDTAIASRKYKYLSSKGYPNGKEHNAQVHWPLGYESSNDIIRVTEGEFKADYTTLNDNTYTISISGVTMWRTALEAIKKLTNIKTVLLAPDSDKDNNIDPYTGKALKTNETNPVARSFACLAKELLKLGLNVHMETWDQSLGKGIDDVLLKKCRPSTMSREDLDLFILQHGKPDFPHSIETTTGHRLLPTKENTKSLTDFLGIDYQYNLMKHFKEVHGCNRNDYYPNNINNSVIQLKSKAVQYGLPTHNLADLVDLISSDHSYHPARQWLESKEWDGVTRVRDLFETLKVKNGWEETRDLYMKKWLISGIAALYAKNYWTKIVLVLVGEGSIGKTTWFENLFGEISGEAFKDGVILDPSNKDSRFLVISNWCVELGELSASFRKRDREELKAFITERADDFRAPYSRESVRFPRQCFFGASVDQSEFLKDEAGDLRFACLPVVDITFDHGLDLQQVWAEVKEVWFDTGEKWWLEGDEITLIKESNEMFRVEDPYQEMLIDAYGDAELAGHNPASRWRTARDVCDELYNLEYTFEKPDSITRKISRILKKLFVKREQSAKTKVTAAFWVPPIKEKGGPELTLLTGGKAEKESIAKTDQLFPTDII